MNRRTFIKSAVAVAGYPPLAGVRDPWGSEHAERSESRAAVLPRFAFAEEGEKKMKSIVIYFSHTGENYSVGNITVGNTAKVAAKIAAATGAATWEIKETDPYPVAYNDCIARAKKELKDKARPAFAGTAPDLSDVDTIYLGYPNWWGDAPMIVYSYLDKAAIDGKTILPFCTHEGSGLGSTARSIAKAYPKAKVELKGLGLYGHVAQNDDKATTDAVDKWLKSLGKIQ